MWPLPQAVLCVVMQQLYVEQYSRIDPSMCDTYIVVSSGVAVRGVLGKKKWGGGRKIADDTMFLMTPQESNLRVQVGVGSALH